MNYFKILIFATLGIFAASLFLQCGRADAKPPKFESLPKPPFDIDLRVEFLEKNIYELIASVKIDSGSYIISPYSKDDILLPFRMDLESNKNFKLIDSLVEIPSTLEEFDKILKTKVRYVRVPTMYKQKIEILSAKKFGEQGLIEFLVEPRCVPYHVEFHLSFDRKMSVTKKEVKIAHYYNGNYKE